MISRVVLGREPDKGGFQKYSAALREGRLSRTALIETLIATAEFKHRRSRVLAIPDHPQFNASTLRYYAEVDRYALSFFHILDGSIDAERLQLYEFVLVKDGGYQGPEFSTQQNDQIQEQLLRPAPGFVPLPQSFACPDQSNIVIFAARSVLN